MWGIPRGQGSITKTAAYRWNGREEEGEVRDGGREVHVRGVWLQMAQARGSEAEGRREKRRLKNGKKKSNAYFGKSLVRLACNQKKKGKSGRKFKKETDCKKERKS